ncbi:MAG TPA: FAD-dependent oxidoreductase [Candidatus Competibacteraceae bacterium]|nr:FAD-dependent oxidoreductase [Candidatus Competibacteraceae bacterium]
MRLAVDVAIVGGGVAGLWLLARLRDMGYAAVLVEAVALGAGQTIRSQGIIHGGTKYALHGRLSGAARTIAAMPALWRRCLEGEGELDLAGVRLLSAHQYLWTSAGLATRLAGFFASRVMASRMDALRGAEIPAALREATGAVYRLDEPVLDVGSLLAAFRERYGSALLWARCQRVDARHGVLALIGAEGGEIELCAERLVLTAGAGNAALSAIPMQRRPLHMVMARAAGLPLVYAHYLGTREVPRLTITSHRAGAGDIVWYLGGQLAEQGVVRSGAAQIAEARRELREALPWLDLSGLRLATLRVDRAEARQTDGGRPDTPTLFREGRALVGWPTKLAMAPLLAESIVVTLEQEGVRPHADQPELPLPPPPVAAYPWEEVGIWS